MVVENGKIMGPIIWIEGLIGAGKTTATNKLAELLKLRPMLEPVDTNPYLKQFYEDPKRWAFPMQMHLLAHRYAMQQAASWESVLGRGAVLDRGLPGDRVFCRLHMLEGNMSQNEWQTYDYIYQIMAANLRVPSLIVYLDVEPEVALYRIQKRARSAEVGMDIDYLQKLRAGYMDLLVQIDSGDHAWRMEYR
jgi:deoxyadenosine/deoxycytidine kinase